MGAHKNEKKILVIFSGGTICTELKDGVRGISGRASGALIDFFEASDSPFAGCGILDGSGKRFNVLSENMTIEKWNELIKYLREDVLPVLDSYKGVIIAHGTDTLAYSAAMFSVLLKGIAAPVFFVSSHGPVCREGKDGRMELSPFSNGNENFRYAVECICYGINPGVYVTYREVNVPGESRRMFLHSGLKLRQCGDYEDDFYSDGAIDITGINEKNCRSIFDKLPSWKTVPAEELPINKMKNRMLKDCVLMLEPYVGMNYRAYRYEMFRAVLHGSYHSGTACVERSTENSEYTDSSILYMIKECRNNDVDVIFAPAKEAGEEDVYESVPFIRNFADGGDRVVFSHGMTRELLYAKLVYFYSCSELHGRKPAEEFLNLNEADAENCSERFSTAKIREFE